MRKKTGNIVDIMCLDFLAYCYMVFGNFWVIHIIWESIKLSKEHSEKILDKTPSIMPIKIRHLRPSERGMSKDGPECVELSKISPVVKVLA
jgi:hypothetical protein